MKLKALFVKKDNIKTKGDIDIEILSLSQKADRKVEKGLYFCVNGLSGDGHNYTKMAQDNGCVALVVERFVDSELPQILVKNIRKIMPKVCNRFFGNITKKLTFVGITGTNGKTSTSQIIYSILNNSGKVAGLIGTNGIKFLDENYNLSMTTPDTVDLFYILSKMQKKGVKYVVMEVSAHALDLNKLHGIKFDIGIFTNLTLDHLDYFKTMHRYALAKLKFLKKFYSKNVIINLDDEYGKLFAKLTDAKLYTYAINSPAQSFAMDIKVYADSTTYLVNALDHVFDVSTNLIGMFNVYNALCSIIACLLLKVDDDIIYKTLCNVPKISGRMNTYSLCNGASAVIDYAHTPDGLEKVIGELNSIKKGNLIVVFGCGGDRDKTKRSVMGSIAYLNADIIILTSDNPRSENPLSIIKDILKGISIDFSESLSLEKTDSQSAILNNVRQDCLNKNYQTLKQNDLKGNKSKAVKINDNSEEFGNLFSKVSCQKINRIKTKNKKVFVEVDRKTAIRLAIKESKAGDIILLAGKGDENYIEINGKKIDYNDKEVIQKYIKDC